MVDQNFKHIEEVCELEFQLNLAKKSSLEEKRKREKLNKKFVKYKKAMKNKVKKVTMKEKHLKKQEKKLHRAKLEFLKSVSSIDVKPPAVELPRQIIYGFNEEEEDILNGYRIQKKIKRDEPNG